VLNSILERWISRDSKSLSSVNSENLKLHLQSAPLAVRIGFLLGMLTKIICGEHEKLKSLFGFALKPIEALLALHEKSENWSHIDSGQSCDIAANLNYDEIVVGSGPGGAIAAAESAKSGKRTIVIEAGGIMDPHIIHHSAKQMYESFRSGGLELIVGRNVMPFAQGCVVGGGSEINSGLYHRLPDRVKQDWLKIFEIEESLWNSHEKIIEESLNIQKQGDTSVGIYRESPILNLASELHLESSRVSRWRKYTGTNFIHFGMNRTYLQTARNLGAVVLPNHSVKNISLRNNGLELNIVGAKCKHTIHSQFATISAGTVGTPALLRQSKLISRRETDFNFHAMTRVAAVFNRDVNDSRDIDPHQAWDLLHTIKIGAAVSTPDLLRVVRQTYNVPPIVPDSRIGVYYASTVPTGRGSIWRVLGTSTPVYRLDKTAKKLIEANTQALISGLKSAGAVEVYGKERNPEISTVHIFGSLPVGRSKKIDKLGFVFGTERRVRVCDASLFPTAPTVNPQGPLAVLSSIISEQIHKTYWQLK
jgi:hypothetical protein